MSAVSHACGLDTHLKDWLSALDVKQVRHAIFFSAAWLSKHSPALIHKALQCLKEQVSFICFRMNCTFSENICQFLSGIPYNG